MKNNQDIDYAEQLEKRQTIKSGNVLIKIFLWLSFSAAIILIASCLFFILGPIVKIDFSINGTTYDVEGIYSFYLNSFNITKWIIMISNTLLILFLILVIIFVMINAASNQKKWFLTRYLTPWMIGIGIIIVGFIFLVLTMNKNATLSPKFQNYGPKIMSICMALVIIVGGCIEATSIIKYLIRVSKTPINIKLVIKILTMINIYSCAFAIFSVMTEGLSTIFTSTSTIHKVLLVMSSIGFVGTILWITSLISMSIFDYLYFSLTKELIVISINYVLLAGCVILFSYETWKIIYTAYGTLSIGSVLTIIPLCGSLICIAYKSKWVR